MSKILFSFQIIYRQMPVKVEAADNNFVIHLSDHITKLEFDFNRNGNPCWFENHVPTLEAQEIGDLIQRYIM